MLLHPSTCRIVLMEIESEYLNVRSAIIESRLLLLRLCSDAGRALLLEQVPDLGRQPAEESAQPVRPASIQMRLCCFTVLQQLMMAFFYVESNSSFYLPHYLLANFRGLVLGSIESKFRD